MTRLSVPARVILLSGPSGSGKSSLAARIGLPVLNLDDFYKDGDDASLPRLPDGGGTDWDSPLSWNADAAVAAIDTLCRTARAGVPVYDITTSARTGERLLDLGQARLFIAEGIFAAEIIGACVALGVLADALCLCGRPSATFRQRLLRDLREGRKPPLYLLRRGWRLMRAERGIVARQQALGAHVCGKAEALSRIAAAVGAVQLPAARSPSTPVDGRQVTGGT